MTWAATLLAFVTAERGVELALASRNTARLRARGAVEAGAGHYPFIVALHAAWLVGLWWLGRNHSLRPAWLAVFAALQVGRAWVIASLAERWTTRIMVLPGAVLVRRGPYRFVRHPNYLIVAGEIAVLPLALGLPLYAAAFSLINGVALAIRIRAEERAVGSFPAPERGEGPGISTPP
ncbi:MAG TPA: isoprenylcysteine carboxylmethyltransferase family protein [Caulobacteraceae bacterium]|nr:isoprenylcysteine carboxylmethyltransferase family protein [Caulobacteraceae bacterium]